MTTSVSIIRKPTFTELEAALNAASIRVGLAQDALARCDSAAAARELADAHEEQRQAYCAREEARAARDALTSSTSTARGAIEWITTTILERGIEGLTMAQDGLAKSMRDYAAAQGSLCVEWNGLGDRDFNNLAIVVEPKHHSPGQITLTVVVRFAAGQWFPQNAIKIAKLYLAVSELALELQAIWADKVLTLG